jgi:aminoglycoside phosphotransferase (APT) family kinase protein
MSPPAEHARHAVAACDAVTKTVGLGGHAAPLGRSGSTFLVRAGATTVVAKRIASAVGARAYEELFAQLVDAIPGACPRLLGVLPEDDVTWWAVFEYVERERDDLEAADWPHARALLVALRDAPVLPDLALETAWIDAAERELPADDHVQAAVGVLRANVPTGGRTLAHGDFSVWNLIPRRDRLVLVDWEEVGSAPAGFDAGWLLALARAGAAAPWEAATLEPALALSFPLDALVWFEAIGLVRLLIRTRGLGIGPLARPLVEAPIRAALRTALRRLDPEVSTPLAEPISAARTFRHRHAT